MPLPAPPPRDDPLLADPAFLDLIEGIREPAVLHLPDGRIAAINSAARGLMDRPVVGMTIGELLDLIHLHRPDGTPYPPGDLPHARALHGEIVTQGERIELTLPSGGTYSTIATSTPIVRDGRVVAALSVWHDFDAYVRRLAGPGLSPEEEPAPDL